MNFIPVLLMVSVLSVTSAIPLNMAKEKKGDEKAVILNTDRTSHPQKRAKEVLMFGNQQNSPRIKKSDPEKEHLSTSDKISSSSSIELPAVEGPPAKLPHAPESEEDRSSELFQVGKIFEKNPLLGQPDSDSDSDSDSDGGESSSHTMGEENKSGSSDADGSLGGIGDEQIDGDKSQILETEQNIPIVNDDIDNKALAELSKEAVDKQTPLILPSSQVEVESQPELPDLGEQLEEEKPADYDELLREYENENSADFRRQRTLQSSPFLNDLYRKRREMDVRPQRTKRDLLLPEDAEQYLKGNIPEKLVTLESWPNAYSQSELLEKEAPYQIVSNTFDDNTGYGYQKRQGVVDLTDDDDQVEPEEDEDEGDVPYQEVVLNGQPGYFIPAKRGFFPYSEEPVSHYSALVDKKDDEADYARLLQLARALAIQHGDNDIFNEQEVS